MRASRVATKSPLRKYLWSLSYPVAITHFIHFTHKRALKCTTSSYEYSDEIKIWKARNVMTQYRVFAAPISTCNSELMHNELYLVGRYCKPQTLVTIGRPSIPIVYLHEGYSTQWVRRELYSLQCMYVSWAPCSPEGQVKYASSCR